MSVNEMRDYVMHKIIFSLPVYQWITSVKRDNKCAFWELLYLIGTSGDRGDELPAEADTEDIPEDNEEDDKKFRCLFCVNVFPTRELFDWHGPFCKEKPL